MLGPRSLVIDDEFGWSDQPLPGGLADHLGAHVVEALSQPRPITVEPWGAESGPWTDVLDAHAGDVVATYGGGTYLDGAPAAVRNGSLWYAGFSGVGAWSRLLAGITGREPVAAPLEVTRRSAVSPGRMVGWRIEIDHQSLDARTAMTTTDDPEIVPPSAR